MALCSPGGVSQLRPGVRYVMVGAGRGWWQAVIPEPNGEQVITRHTRLATRRADRRARTVAVP